MRIRGGSGLGDAIYTRVIAEHFIRAGNEVTVCSDYPDVFLGSGATVTPFDRHNIDVLAHYTAGKRDPTTNQWQDICRSACIYEIPLRFDWTVRNQTLIDELVAYADGRPLVIIHGGRTPMGRSDGFGKELLPEKRAFDAVLSQLDDCFLVRVGKGADAYPLVVDRDLNDKTTVTDLIDIGSVCDGIVGQCSFAIPLAEVFAKPLLVVWAARGMHASCHPYIQQIVPRKVLSKVTSDYAVDDWPVERLHAIGQLFNARASGRALPG